MEIIAYMHYTNIDSGFMHNINRKCTYLENIFELAYLNGSGAGRLQAQVLGDVYIDCGPTILAAYCYARACSRSRIAGDRPRTYRRVGKLADVEHSIGDCNSRGAEQVACWRGRTERIFGRA